MSENGFGGHTVAHQASHLIARDELAQWLAEHGVDISQVVEARIEIGRNRSQGKIWAWLDVEFCLLNDRGERYRAGDTDDPAMGHSTIPLRSWPQLTPVADG